MIWCRVGSVRVKLRYIAFDAFQRHTHTLDDYYNIRELYRVYDWRIVLSFAVVLSFGHREISIFHQKSVSVCYDAPSCHVSAKRNEYWHNANIVTMA